MDLGEAKPITLHAAPVPHTLTLTGDDLEIRASTTATVAELLGDPPAVLLTGSCSAALEASAVLLGIGPGDEVIVPAYTFPTSVSPFVAAGASMRFADVDPATGNIDARHVGALLTDATRAVVVTHYAGIAADLGDVAGLLAEIGAELIEDAAHAMFGRWQGRPLGRIGRFGALSFHHTKNLSALAGGALVVNHPSDVDRAQVAVDKGTNRVQFDRGAVRAYEWAGLGSAWRMPEAAVRYLARELDRRATIQRRRAEVWSRYDRELSPWADEHGVARPHVPDGASCPAHLYFLVLPEADDRDRFVDHLASYGVQAARHFGSLPDSSFGRTLVRPGADFPGARRLHRCLVRIPLHDQLAPSDVDRVIAAVSSWRPS